MRLRHALPSPTWLPALLLALALSSARPAPAQASAEAMASLRRADSSWARMYAVHDTVLALQLMAEDMIFTSSTGAQKTRAQEIADVRPMAGLTMQYFRTEDVVARIYGDAGVVVGVASWAFESGGSTSSIRRRYTAVYARGGPLGWRLVTVHMGSPPRG